MGILQPWCLVNWPALGGALHTCVSHWFLEFKVKVATLNHQGCDSNKHRCGSLHVGVIIVIHLQASRDDDVDRKPTRYMRKQFKTPSNARIYDLG